jgi:hypothetical protein
MSAIVMLAANGLPKQKLVGMKQHRQLLLLLLLASLHLVVLTLLRRTRSPWESHTACQLDRCIQVLTLIP